MIRSRRNALAAIGGSIALTAAPFGRLAAQTKSELRASIIPIFDVAPYFAAQAQGYFAAENVTVTTENVGGGGAAMIPALVGGDFDLAYANAPSVALAVARGIDLRILLAGAPVGKTPPSTVALVKRADDPSKTGKDLEGKAIAVNALDNVQWMVARAWVKHSGGDPDKVTYVEIPLPAQLDALKTNRVAAAMVVDPFLTLGLAQPQSFAVLAWAFNEVYADLPIAVWITNQQSVQTKAPQLAAFVRAFRKGVAWVNDNRGKDALVQLLASYSHVEPALIEKITIPLASSDVHPEVYPRLIAMMRENKLLTKDVDLASHVYRTG